MSMEALERIGGGPGAAVLLLLAVALAGCAPRDPVEQRRRAATLRLEPCRLEQVGRPASCGRYTVFEQRADRRGRELELFVAVLPAQARRPAADPVFLLAGGPGQGASATFGPLLGALDQLAEQRDVVLLDQRGTGRSAPLECETHADDLQRVLSEDSLSRLAAECLPKLAAAADLSQYTTPVAADDLDEVRAALGYERLNLVGMSYGTRLALVYAARHPDRVRTLVLDGVAPTDMALPLFAARDGQRAFDRLVEDCHAEPSCRAAYPDLASDLTGLLAALEDAPARTELRHPRTGEPVALTIGRGAVAAAVHGLLYSTELSSLLPYTITRAKFGDFAPLAAQGALLAEEQRDRLSLGLLLSVVCSEDVDRIPTRRQEAALDGTFLEDELVEEWQRACADWPRAALPEGYGEPIRLDDPVLVLSGRLDPVTPPAWGEGVARHLSAATHVVVPQVGHGTIGRGCVGELVADFVEAGSTSGLDTGCVDEIHRPPFFVSFAGPVP